MLQRNVKNCTKQVEWLIKYASRGDGVIRDHKNSLFVAHLSPLMGKNMSETMSRCAAIGMTSFVYTALEPVDRYNDHQTIYLPQDYAKQLIAFYNDYRYRHKPYFGNTRRAVRIQWSVISQLAAERRYGKLSIMIIPGTISALCGFVRGVLNDVCLRSADLYYGGYDQIYGAKWVHRFFRYAVGEETLNVVRTNLYEFQHHANSQIIITEVDEVLENVQYAEQELSDFKTKVTWLLIATAQDGCRIQSKTNSLLYLNIVDLLKGKIDFIRSLVGQAEGRYFYRTLEDIVMHVDRGSDNRSSVTYTYHSDQNGDWHAGKAKTHRYQDDWKIDEKYNNFKSYKQLVSIYNAFRYDNKQYFGNVSRSAKILWHVSIDVFSITRWYRAIVVAMSNIVFAVIALPTALVYDLCTRHSDIYYGKYDLVYQNVFCGKYFLSFAKFCVGMQNFEGMVDEDIYREMCYLRKDAIQEEVCDEQSDIGYQINESTYRQSYPRGVNSICGEKNAQTPNLLSRDICDNDQYFADIMEDASSFNQSGQHEQSSQDESDDSFVTLMNKRRAHSGGGASIYYKL